MQYNPLGNTGLTVSELCFGTLPMGPLQADLPPETGAVILAEAMRSGITFFDTAQMYGTYEHLRRAFETSGKKYETVVSSKSTAADYDTMRQAVEEALQKLERDYIDIFLLHAARIAGDPRQLRPGAWECLLEMKEKGYIRACGVSTHVVPTAEKLAEGGLDVMFPLYNQAGLGLIDGDPERMRLAVEKAAVNGVGCFSMKMLGGGNLLSEYAEAVAFARSVSAFSAHALGMLSVQELETNLRVFNGEELTPRELRALKKDKQLLISRPHCKHCGKCAERCPNYAIRMVADQPQVDKAKCLLCGYCAGACPQFAIRIK